MRPCTSHARQLGRGWRGRHARTDLRTDARTDARGRGGAGPAAGSRDPQPVCAQRAHTLRPLAGPTGGTRGPALEALRALSTRAQGHLQWPQRWGPWGQPPAPWGGSRRREVTSCNARPLTPAGVSAAPRSPEAWVMQAASRPGSRPVPSGLHLAGTAPPPRGPGAPRDGDGVAADPAVLCAWQGRHLTRVPVGCPSPPRRAFQGRGPALHLRR